MDLTRRNFIGTGLAGTAAVAAGTLPAMAIPALSDAKLLQLCRNWHRLHRAFIKALHRQDDAKEAQGPLPDIPELLQQGFDVFPDCAGYGKGHAVPPISLCIDGYEAPEIVSRNELMDVARGGLLFRALLSARL